MERSDRPVTVCGHRLSSPCHICCFFDSREQQYEVLVPYFSEGLANGEKVMSVMDGHLFEDHFQRLATGRLPVDSAQRSGHLCTFSTEETYLAGGSFEKTRMMNMLTTELKGISGSGFSRLRTCGDMSWMLRNMPGTEEAMAYESEVNALLQTYDATFMCLYDSSKVSGTTMRDILNTHSHVLMGSVVYENPYFVTPEDYRRTMVARRSATSSVLPDEPGESAIGSRSHLP